MELSRGSKITLVVLLLAVAVVGGAVWTLVATGGTAGGDLATGETVTVEIPEGVGAEEVAERLSEAGVIENTFSFRAAARLDGRSGEIRPGEYELETGMSTSEILDVVTAGPPPRETFTFTVPEGLTVEQTLERIAEAEGSPFDVPELEEALVGVPLPEWVPVDELPDGAQLYEGLLFPATYTHFVEDNAQAVLSEMIATTGEALDAVAEPEGRSRYELLVIASLIEREVRVAEEREIVSSVIANRLSDGMRLQIDATVQYARGEHSGQLLFDDLRIDSAWNTYESDGLPPTPIAAPGQASIDAAAAPADSPYRFYVVCDTETGEHSFAETTSEHESNVAAYRTIQDEGGRVCEQ